MTSSAAALDAGVGVVAAHRLVLAVAPLPLAVLVALVGGDVDHHARRRAWRRTASSTLTVPITLVSNVSRGAANDRRTSGWAAMWTTISGAAAASAAATASASRTSPSTLAIPSRDAGQLVQRRVGGDAGGEAGDLGAERCSQSAQPGALEPGVAGQRARGGRARTPGRRPCSDRRLTSSATAARPSPRGRSRIVAIAQRVHRLPEAVVAVAGAARRRAASARSGSCSQTRRVAAEVVARRSGSGRRSRR